MTSAELPHKWDEISLQDDSAQANEEFHIRLNNFDDPGSQYVEFCLDRDGDGCDDVNKRVRDSISIKWLDN